MTGGPAGPAHVPPSLLDEGLRPVWAQVRRYLDRHGTQRRGAIAMPDIDPAGKLTLRSLLGRVNKRLDLAELEAALAARRIGDDLSEALTRLGHPPSAKAAHRRTVRARSAAARTALRDSVEPWPEPWAREWADAVIGAGLHGGCERHEVETLIHGVRRLLDYLDDRDSITTATGRSHHLDPGPRGEPGVDEPARPVGSPPAAPNWQPRYSVLLTPSIPEPGWPPS